MERKWKVQRSMIERPDGQRRWDCAYQCILRWAKEAVSEPDENLPLSTPQEEEDECRRLRSCLDSAPATGTDN